ncbi:MAG: DUF2306 domain-containing protein [Gemmatimonadaceae bacterium]|nr:DUF2306 domain-containing protein [Gemmatimonadaceae bacterium]
MSPLGWIHVTFATSAMVIGAVVVLRPKGTRTHRAIGWAYVTCMLGLNITALMIYRLFGHFGPFHVAAIASLISVSVGMYFVIARPTKNWLALHYSFMSWSYVGLLAAAASEIGTRVEAFHFWWAVLIATVLVVGCGGLLVVRNQRRILKRFGKLATERVARKPYSKETSLR